MLAMMFEFNVTYYVRGDLYRLFIKHVCMKCKKNIHELRRIVQLELGQQHEKQITEYCLKENCHFYFGKTSLYTHEYCLAMFVI